MVMYMFMNMMVFVPLDARIDSRTVRGRVLLLIFRPRGRLRPFLFITGVDVREFLLQPTHDLRHGPGLVFLPVAVAHVVRGRRVPQNRVRELFNVLFKRRRGLVGVQQLRGLFVPLDDVFYVVRGLVQYLGADGDVGRRQVVFLASLSSVNRHFFVRHAHHGVNKFVVLTVRVR